MSIVKYHNQKTGQVLVYESTPHYDPKTQQNRPQRKYLGYEDPVTHEFHPSSGKRGRPSSKAKTEQEADSNLSDFEALYKSAASETVSIKQQLTALQSDMKHLQEENKKLAQLVKEYEQSFRAIHKLSGSHITD